MTIQQMLCRQCVANTSHRLSAGQCAVCRHRARRRPDRLDEVPLAPLDERDEQRRFRELQHCRRLERELLAAT